MRSSNQFLKTITSFTIILFLFLLFNCDNQAKKSEEEMKKLVDKLDYMQNSGDYSKINEIFSTDLLWHDGNKVDHKGVDFRKEDLISLRERYPDSKWDTQQLIIKDDKIVMHYVFTGTHAISPFIGKKVTIPGVEIFRIENGKIAEEWSFFNSVPVIKALGYTITPPTIEGKE